MSAILRLHHKYSNYFPQIAKNINKSKQIVIPSERSERGNLPCCLLIKKWEIATVALLLRNDNFIPPKSLFYKIFRLSSFVSRLLYLSL